MVLHKKIVEHITPKKELFIVLSYAGMSSLWLKTNLQKTSITTFHFLKLKLFLKRH